MVLVVTALGCKVVVVLLELAGLRAEHVEERWGQACVVHTTQRASWLQQQL
jgi:hypothetical protein